MGLWLCYARGQSLVVQLEHGASVLGVRDALGNVRSFALKHIHTFQIQSYCESVTPMLTRFLNPDV